MKPIQISTHTLNGQDFDVLVHKGKISYIFEVNGNRYGNAVKVKGRTRKDTVDAAFNLFTNLISTYEAVQKAGSGATAAENRDK